MASMLQQMTSMTYLRVVSCASSILNPIVVLVRLSRRPAAQPAWYTDCCPYLQPGRKKRLSNVDDVGQAAGIMQSMSKEPLPADRPPFQLNLAFRVCAIAIYPPWEDSLHVCRKMFRSLAKVVQEITVSSTERRKILLGSTLTGL